MKRFLNLKFCFYIIIRLIVVLGALRAAGEGRYFVTFQCMMTLLLFMLPSILDRRFNIELPNVLEFSVILFIFASIFLGEVEGYYQQFRLWDAMLHTCSGFLTAAIGFSLIDLLNRSEQVKFSLSPGFVALFAFCFSMTIGVVWEFYEFGMDFGFDFDMQKDCIVNRVTSQILGDTVEVKSATINGKKLSGLLDIGLVDTMKDLIVNAIGAVVFSFCGLGYIKYRESVWVKELMPRQKRK